MNELLSARRPLLTRIFFDHNPFYLLSAMCMLAGLFSLNDSLDWSPLPVNNLLWLILILNIYETMLIGLGVFLARRGQMRDAATLFVLEAFFLADAGFLNSEVFTFDFNLGLGINVLLFALAGVKLAAVFWGLGLCWTDGRYGLVLVQMLVLLGAPGLFKYVSQHNNGSMNALAFYGVWWIVGSLPILYVFLLRKVQWQPHRAIVAVLVVLPFVSILAHLCTANWVYNVRWYMANLSPLLLGLAAALGASDRHVTNVALRMRCHLLLPALAILLTLPAPSKLAFEMNDAAMNPLRLTLLAAVAVYVYGIFLHRHAYFAVAGAACLCAAGLGESPAIMTQNVATISRSSASAAWRFVPHTVVHWGLTWIGASFVLLGLGFALSLFKPAAKPSGVEVV